MEPIKVRNLEIGTGIPKICVPITGTNREDILGTAERAVSSAADLVEWRADWCEDIFDRPCASDILCGLRQMLGEIPLLFTFRTVKEGGEKETDPDGYRLLARWAAKSGLIDLLDVELSAGRKTVQELIEEAHRHNVKVIVSSHDFQGTPPEEEILSRMKEMDEMGADILKVAVMPKSSSDVLTLLSATRKIRALCADRPVITMSMGGTGLVSRLCGETFGSAVTFGSLGKASAPGQISVGELAHILDLLHRNL